jgi:PleD family two-component response regulator
VVSVTNAQVIQRLSILLADSRAYSRALLRSMLMQLEVKKIHEVADGAAAIDVIVAVNPDVLILDWDISVLGARSVMSMARDPAVVPNAELPILVISSSGQSADVYNAIELGAQQFMVRPISPNMLEQRLVGIVRDARRTARQYREAAQQRLGDATA